MPSLQPIRAVLLAILFAPGFWAALGREVLCDTNSAYNHIIVEEDNDGLRYLLFSEGGAYQSVRRPGQTNTLELPYSRTMMVGLACVAEPERILVMGLGGGSIPSFLHARYPQTRIDCVEIDPAVIEVAKRFFDFREDDHLKAHAADGRKFIEETTARYDLIFLDAYRDDFIPRQLTTREFLLAVRRVLSPQGVVLGNIWSRASNPLFDSMARTYQDVFSRFCLFHVPARGNIIFLAAPGPGRFSLDQLSRRTRSVMRDRHLGFDLRELVRSGYSEPNVPPDTPILLD